MKFVIFLTILSLSFLSYYFFAINKAKDNETKLNELPVITPIKENPINKVPQSSTIIKIEPKVIKQNTKNKVNIDKEYISLSDLKMKLQMKKALQNKNEKTTSYEYEIFLQLKKMIEQSSSTYYAKSSITLNSHINSLLFTSNSKEKFKQLLKNNFNLDDIIVDKEFNKNKTLWDWVRFLTP